MVYVPPSYGVPGGPLKEPLRCVRSSPFPTGSAFIFERLSEWISATSFAMRRVRLDDMVGGMKLSLWTAGRR